MYDPAPRRGPLTPDERWFVGLFVALLVGLLAAEIYHDFQPVKLSALLVVLFWIPLLALHELGHALAAALLNWHVGQVVIGMGRVLSSFRIRTTVIEIRLLPVEGFVTCVPKDLRLPQIKSALIYFAGPGVELVLAVGILLLIEPERLLTRSDDYLLIGWQSLALASAAQAVLNLIPHSVRTPEGERANDGLGMILSFHRPEGYYADMIGNTYNQETRDWEAYDPADWWKRDK